MRDREGPKESDGPRKLVRGPGPRGWVVCSGAESESEGTSVLEHRSWVQTCRRAWGRSRGRKGEADPKGMVSGSGAGLLKGQQKGEKVGAWGQQPSRASRGNGSGVRAEGPQGPVCSPLGPGSKATAPAAR